MYRKTFAALIGAFCLAVAGATVAVAATGSGPAVRVQIKTAGKTLRQVVVHGRKSSITKEGTPRGKCSGNSAAGALDAATHGRWSGKYYASVGGIFITSILGVTPKSPQYWSLLVNGKTSTSGACAVRLHAGDKLLFEIVK